MRDGVDKGIVLSVPANFTNQESGVQHDPADDHRQQQRTQEEKDSAMPVEQNPTDVKKKSDENQSSAERDKERN
jgi:hypothetical protein